MTLFIDYIIQVDVIIIWFQGPWATKKEDITRILNNGAQAELHFWKDVAGINMFAEIRLNLPSCSGSPRVADHTDTDNGFKKLNFDVATKEDAMISFALSHSILIVDGWHPDSH